MIGSTITLGAFSRKFLVTTLGQDSNHDNVVFTAQQSAIAGVKNREYIK